MQTAEQPPPAVVGPSDGESHSTLQPVTAADPAPVEPKPVADPITAEPDPAAAVAAPEEHIEPKLELKHELTNGMDAGNGLDAMHGMDHASNGVDASKGSEDTNPDMMMEAERSSARKRVPTAAAAAAGEQAEAEAMARGKPRRKKSVDDGSVSRTTHGGVKIGGRAVTWVGGAGMSREVLDKMGIPQLRAVFLKTFMHPTGSNNAEWLRKKLAQPPDPNVGAARAAVPRARDVTAEIWTTGTQFKGFTKQERFRLQQMGGNCEAKVVEVVGNEDEGLPKSKKKSYKGQVELHTMQVIGNEKFEMPPPKRLRGGPLAHNSDMTGVKGLSFDGSDMAGGPPVSMGPMYDPADGTIQPAVAGEPSVMATQWRNLQFDERHLLQAGMNVKVYRADENWHHGSLHKVSYVGPEDDLRMCVTIYYWEHDQSETRDIAEFFRGDSTSLIQWQAPANPEAMMFQPAQSHTGEDAAMSAKPSSSPEGAAGKMFGQESINNNQKT